MDNHTIQVSIKPYGATRASVQNQIVHALRDAGIPVIRGLELSVSHGVLSRQDDSCTDTLEFCWRMT
jgi:hypothetical protein